MFPAKRAEANNKSQPSASAKRPKRESTTAKSQNEFIPA